MQLALLILTMHWPRNGRSCSRRLPQPSREWRFFGILPPQAGIGQFAVIQSAAPSIGVDVSAIKLRDAAQIEQDVARFANSPNGGLILTGSPIAVINQNLVVALAARHKLPAVYYRRYFVTSGGLISYGPDIDEQYRGAASYVDRILKGEKPSDLPVQAPTKYELVINL